MKTSANKNTMLKNPKIVKTSPSTVKTAPPGKAAAKSFDVAQVCSVDLGSDGGVRLPPLTLQSRVEPEDVVDARFRLVEARSQTVVLTDRQFDVHLKRLVKVFMSEVSITRDMRALNSKRSLQPADRLLLQDLEILKGKFKEERSNLVVTLSMDSRNRSKLNSTKEANTQSQDKHERPSDSADDVIPSTSKTSKLRKCSVPSRKQGGAQPKVPSNPPSNPVKTLSMGSRHRSQKSSTTEIQPEANNQDQKEEEPSDYFDVVTPSTSMTSRKQGGAQAKITSNPPIICKNIVAPEELSIKLMEKLKQRFAKTTESPKIKVPLSAQEKEPVNESKMYLPNAPVAAPVTAPVAAPVTAPVAAPVAAPAAAPVAASVAAPVAARVTSSVSSTAKIKAKAKPKELSESLSDIFYDFPIAIY
ncbi:uncharacterized protein LOC6591988 [Drosophila persimilis]|uniref:uncharacterized protein LOC6591988 n=1 Tax=Drosophila persimilis TaxID=7234 RepID=UPI000F08B328|nr:uncharacterized protein LOC6591988 [Drosophila persimilis]